jgi:hypothetical protein
MLSPWMLVGKLWKLKVLQSKGQALFMVHLSMKQNLTLSGIKDAFE